MKGAKFFHHTSQRHRRAVSAARGS